MPDLSPAGIRALRGPKTRAAFAEQVGVTAHTIYRWEQPEGSTHGRRPRGEELARLTAMTMPATDPESLAVAAAVQRMLDGDWKEAEGTLLRAVADRDATIDARSLAATGLALIELMFRADSRRALAALAPALAPNAPPLAIAEGTAALAYAYPDGELFDLGVVHAHARRARELGSDALASSLAVTAEITAALMSGEDDLLMRSLADADAIAIDALPAIPALFLEHYRSMSLTMSGRNRAAIDRLDRMLANPALLKSPVLEARTCATRAMRSLDELGDPQEALAMAQRSHRVAADGRLAVGVHTALALRAEGEALLRLGRMSDAEEVFARSDRIFAERGFPVTTCFATQQRFMLAMGRADELEVIAARLAKVANPSMRAISVAYSAWLSATAALLRGTDPEATMAAFAHADRLAQTFGFLRRDLLVSYAGAALIDGDLQLAREVIARAQRATDARPAAWFSAQLRRAQGTLLIAEGRIDEGRTLMEAALATFEASSDRLDAALCRFGVAGLARVCGAPDADDQTARADAALVALGLPRPDFIARAIAATARRVSNVPVDRRDNRLELGLQRLAVNGASTAIVLRELAAVAEELTGAPAILEEDVETQDTAHAWFALAGGGKRMRLGVVTSADPAPLRMLAIVAGLALDVAMLRGGERPTATPDAPMEVPGVIAASPLMRRLLADVSRLAGSRATVVLTGESGAGKEVIARALHQLSPRSQKPYVAFNCAAVPHDLFEGQLFGYRKGAFTGAVGDHPGVLRAADGGSVFLDEIGELPPSIQPKLLRFLDSGEIFPLGAQRPSTVDVRVIAATNRDLAAEVRAGRFREDLYYRLQVVPLVVPPLRERREDILPLARFFARALSHRSPAFAPDALAALTAHAWPGNVRELKNAIERALAYAPDGVITRGALGLI